MIGFLCIEIPIKKKKKAEIKGPGSLVQNYLFLVFVTCLVDWINQMENAFSQTRKLAWKEMYYTYFLNLKAKYKKIPPLGFLLSPSFFYVFLGGKMRKVKGWRKSFECAFTHVCMEEKPKIYGCFWLTRNKLVKISDLCKFTCMEKMHLAACRNFASYSTLYSGGT